MQFHQAFAINLSIEKIDMYRWVTEMTPEDYVSFSPGHKAMGSFFRGHEFLMTNVEYIGTDMFVQHYRLVEHGKSDVKFHSAETEGYLYRWFPVSVGVRWEMALRPTAAGSCELQCTIGADFPSKLLAVAAQINGLGGYFIKRHLSVEGVAFAKDIERKFASQPGDVARPT